MTERPPLIPDLFRMLVKMFVGGVFLILLVSCGAAAIGSSAGGGRQAAEKSSRTLYGEEDSENAILRVDIQGPILTHKSDDASGFFGGLDGVTYGYEVKEQLLDAAKNDDVDAVMMFVSTPGGTVVGSQAIHQGVEAVKAAGKPVVAYVDGLSASGGVWSTAAADKIYADHGSLIGSVGVIFGIFPYFNDPVAFDGTLFSSGVTTRGGIEMQVISASEGKDIFNPFRPFTEREKTLLEAGTKEIYDDFLNHVVANRGMDREALINDYGAMVFSNDMAEARGYIDGTKNFQETIRFIAAEIGAEGDDWKVISPPEEQKSPFEQMFGAYLSAIDGEASRLGRSAGVCADLSGRPAVISYEAYSNACAR